MWEKVQDFQAFIFFSGESARVWVEIGELFLACAAISVHFPQRLYTVNEENICHTVDMKISKSYRGTPTNLNTSFIFLGECLHCHLFKAVDSQKKCNAIYFVHKN